MPRWQSGELKPGEAAGPGPEESRNPPKITCRVVAPPASHTPHPAPQSARPAPPPGFSAAGATDLFWVRFGERGRRRFAPRLADPHRRSRKLVEHPPPWMRIKSDQRSRSRSAGTAASPAIASVTTKGGIANASHMSLHWRDSRRPHPRCFTAIDVDF